MKNLVKTATAIALVFTFGSQVLADTPKLDKRQDKQQARIAQGVNNGELTKKETARMVKGQVQLQRMENRVKSDGVITGIERARLQQKANKESAKIYRNKNDKQKRPKARRN